VTDANPEFESCAICGRTILRGERATEYVDGDGERVGVCALCKGRAEAAGWVPAAFAATMSRHSPERRRVRVGSALRERFVRRLEAERAAQAAAEAPPEPERPARPPTPLEVFNASGEARKVAGLVRSLGAPRVSVRREGPDAALIVVAWDLSWYRWRVEGERVSELAKGNEISELPVADRDWNASAAEDGTLSLD
jgi:hypothetical protein